MPVASLYSTLKFRALNEVPPSMYGRIRAKVLQPPSTNWVPGRRPEGTLKLVDSPDGGKAAVGALVVVQSQADLLQVVGALGAAGGLAGRLHGGKQQRDQDGDDGDHHQQLDQGETPTSWTICEQELMTSNLLKSQTNTYREESDKLTKSVDRSEGRRIGLLSLERPSSRSFFEVEDDLVSLRSKSLSPGLTVTVRSDVVSSAYRPG